MGSVASVQGSNNEVCGYGLTEQEALKSLDANLYYNYGFHLSKDEKGYYANTKGGYKVYSYSTQNSGIYKCYLN